MEYAPGCAMPGDELSAGFEKDRKFQQKYSLAVNKWPNVSDEEYILILPTIWVLDLFNQESLCHMPYAKFLRTRYWRAISWRAKTQHPWCHDCAEYLQQLHVHHKTYIRRGLEWLFPDDLVVLCHFCHKTRHGL